MLYEYIGRCDNLDGDLIREMVDDASIEISWQTLVKHVGQNILKDLFPDYTWGQGNAEGLRMKKDWAVSCWKGHYSGWPCYYIYWSAYEYVFTKPLTIKTVPAEFRSIWKNCDRLAAFELINKIRPALGFMPYSEKQLDEGWQYRTIFAESYEEAKDNFVSFTLGLW